MNEYRIRISVRNNLLLSAIEAAGYPTQAAFARAIDASVTAVSALVSLRESPINHNGEFSALAKQIMEVLGAAPNDLWTDEQLYMKLTRNSASTTAGAEEVKRLIGESLTAQALPVPEEFVEELELTRDVHAAMAVLTPREVAILAMRHKDEKTREEIAAALDVSVARVHQIENTAYRKLRNSRVTDKLIEHLPALREDREKSQREYEAFLRKQSAEALQKVKNARPK